MDDQVIDLGEYLRQKSGGPGGVFAVWGGVGERARFALPLWRAIYLLRGDRGGIVWLEKGSPEPPAPFFVLDLGEDPARLGFPMEILATLGGKEAPAVEVGRGGSAAVLLGSEDGRSWFLVVDGRKEDLPPAGKAREDLLFLSGECAGLLFHRDFAREGEGGEG